MEKLIRLVAALAVAASCAGPAYAGGGKVDGDALSRAAKYEPRAPIAGAVSRALKDVPHHEPRDLDDYAKQRDGRKRAEGRVTRDARYPEATAAAKRTVPAAARKQRDGRLARDGFIH